MNNQGILQLFFEAENRRDWENYKVFLHPNVEWTLFNDKENQTISGLESYMSKIKTAYGESNDSFSCEIIYSSKSGNRVVAILINNYGQRSTDVFEFENGLIRKEWEFLLG